MLNSLCYSSEDKILISARNVLQFNGEEPFNSGAIIGSVVNCLQKEFLHALSYMYRLHVQVTCNLYMLLCIGQLLLRSEVSAIIGSVVNCLQKEFLHALSYMYRLHVQVTCNLYMLLHV